MKYFIEKNDINLIIDSLSFTSHLLDKYQLDIKHFYDENNHVIWTQKDIDCLISKLLNQTDRSVIANFSRFKSMLINQSIDNCQ